MAVTVGFRRPCGKFLCVPQSATCMLKFWMTAERTTNRYEPSSLRNYEEGMEVFMTALETAVSELGRLKGRRTYKLVEVLQLQAR